MKIRKLMLPMMAVVCAIGMTFATAETSYSAAVGFIETAQGWEQVDVNCEDGDFTCRVAYESDPETEYIVYEAPNSQSNELESTSPDAILISD